jgi:nucleotide-binding universal stress UspA family protein
MIKIIVATDFSLVADNAVDYAAELCKQFNAKLIIYNAFVVPIHASNSLLSANEFQELLDENSSRLKESAEATRLKYKIEVDFETTYSFLEDELESLLVRYNASLIVIGMSTKSLEQDLMGNATTAVIKRLKYPVLAVPLAAKFTGMKKLLFACDVLRGVPVKVLEQIKNLTKELDSEIELFYVDKTIEDIKNDNKSIHVVDIISDGLDGVTYSYKNVRSNAVIFEIEKEIVNFQAELLIMIPKKYGFWASLVHKSKTRMMASGLGIPLLSVPL